MILHKTTVCLTVWLCVWSPPPLATVVALNRQILIFGNSFCRSMTSFLHSLTAALTRKDEISNSQISKTQKQKLVSLFYFRFLLLLPFFRRIFLQICFVIFVYCFCSSSAVGSIDRQFAESSRDVLGISRDTDRQRDHMVNSRPTRPLLRHWNRNHVLVKVGCPVQKSKSKTHNKCKSATNRGVKSHSHSHSESFQTIVSCGTHA